MNESISQPDGQRGSLLGPRFSNDEIRKFLDSQAGKIPSLRRTKRHCATTWLI